MADNVCVKQEAAIDDFIFPEFIIRRMNSLHRHRVNATLKRLWYRPVDPKINSGEKVVWAGSPGCGKSIAVSEIVLECILKLQEVGNVDNQSKWPFFLKE